MEKREREILEKGNERVGERGKKGRMKEDDEERRREESCNHVPCTIWS